MAIATVTLNTKFDAWKDITNDVIAAIGDNDTLTTTVKTSLVAAINELTTKVGDLTTLDTVSEVSIVAAINEVLAGVGDVGTLSTTATTSVEAINEVLTQLGDISTLTTQNKSATVNAINEIVTNIGTLASLSTTEQGTLVGAINEVDGKIDDGLGDLSTLTTTVKTSAVGAINEVDGKIEDGLGDLSTLTTTDKTSAVTAINEAHGASMKIDHIQYTNTEPNAGRNATDDLTSITVATSAMEAGILQIHNTSTLVAGEKFINDNSNYGGAGATLGTDASTLIAALGTKGGRTEQRYGFEFYINDITAGANTQDGITESTIDYYPCVANGERMLGSIGRKVTFSAWMKLKTLNTPANNGIILGSPTLDIDLYIDGGLETDPYLLTVADGWVHVTQVLTLTKEFEQFFPGIFANSGDVVQVALPVLIPAEIGIEMHTGLVN